MHQSPQLYWLPPDSEWRTKLRVFAQSCEPTFAEATALARTRLDFIQTNALAEAIKTHWGDSGPQDLTAQPIRLAILASCTMDHLLPAIRVAAARRGLWVETYLGDYGQYLQELLDTSSRLHAFRPNAVLLALDAAHISRELTALTARVERDDIFNAQIEQLSRCWQLAREAFNCTFLQQAILPTPMPLMGSADFRLPGSKSYMVNRLNAWIREAAPAGGVNVIAIDDRAARDGLQVWHDAALWLRSKQDVKPVAAPMYGELVARILAAQRGLSSKCLVFDLDNTIWGGVIGDDGLEGITLGPGSALGEAFVDMQLYVKDLSRRGIILAISSKNDERNANEVFERHPEMVLKRSDIASFAVNWEDKASNIKQIATELNIGLDSVVFLDDNPFERALVRQELPMVNVPEVGDDPVYYPLTLADAGYFEAIALTAEDLERTRLYQENISRDQLKSSTTDLSSYLESLRMELTWRPFDELGLQRVTQLINKTNQFNLTTKRYTEDEVRAIINDDRSCGLQFRLKDKFGDNGIIAIVIGNKQDNDFVIDTWLMSCRVLGRQVEAETLNVIVGHALKLGLHRIVGKYRPTAKNSMVKNHFQSLGFEVLSENQLGEIDTALNLKSFTPIPNFIASYES